MISDTSRQERNSNVLRHVVKIYVSTASPVSSGMVAKRIGRLSSATVRNIMGELEEAGLIAQPHTSAGRVPTDLGYRHYVNDIKETLKVEKREAERLARQYASRARTIKDIIEKTSSIIGSELHQASMFMWPSVDDLYLKHLQLVKMNAENILAVLVTMSNAVKDYIVKIDRRIEKTELDRISNFVNENYEEEKVTEIPSRIRSMISGEKENGTVEMARRAIEIIDNISHNYLKNEVYFSGLEHFASEPEFVNSGLAGDMLRLFSGSAFITDFLQGELPEIGVRTYIGRENSRDTLRTCSIVTSGYRHHGKTVGRIGVVGPTRMDYDRVMGTIKYISDIISAKLEEFDRV